MLHRTSRSAKRPFGRLKSSSEKEDNNNVQKCFEMIMLESTCTRYFEDNEVSCEWEKILKDYNQNLIQNGCKTTTRPPEQFLKVSYYNIK